VFSQKERISTSFLKLSCCDSHLFLFLVPPKVLRIRQRRGEMRRWQPLFRYAFPLSYPCLPLFSFSSERVVFPPFWGVSTFFGAVESSVVQSPLPPPFVDAPIFGCSQYSLCNGRWLLKIMRALERFLFESEGARLRRRSVSRY